MSEVRLEIDSNGTSHIKIGSSLEGHLQIKKNDFNMVHEEHCYPYSSQVIEGEFSGMIKGQEPMPDLNTFYTLEYFDSETEIDIHIVGAGGTGGYVIRDLSRFLYSIRERGASRPVNTYVYDGDKVEEKNVLRQNFIPQDLGRYKAEVSCERYSEAYGIQMTAINSFVTKEDLRFYDLISNGMNCGRVQVVVSCVDNNAARRYITQTCEALSSSHRRELVLIDSGNESKGGQIVFSSNLSNRFFVYPTLDYYYPEVADPSKDDTSENNVSCAERTTVDSQNIFVNITAANHILNLLGQILMNKRIYVSIIEFNIRGVSKVKYLTSELIDNYRNGIR